MLVKREEKDPDVAAQLHSFLPLYMYRCRSVALVLADCRQRKVFMISNHHRLCRSRESLTEYCRLQPGCTRVERWELVVNTAEPPTSGCWAGGCVHEVPRPVLCSQRSWSEPCDQGRLYGRGLTRAMPHYAWISSELLQREVWSQRSH